MTHEEIIAMAREASSMARLPWNGEWIFRSKKELMAFAALVAAKEREACADLCDKFAARTTEAQQGPSDSLFNVMWRMGLLSHGECARAIRARGTKEGV